MKVDNLKTVEEVKQAYIEKFGGYPSVLLMGADDETIIDLLKDCLKKGKELGAEDDLVY